MLDLVNSAGEHNALDRVLVNLDTDLTNQIVQMQILRGHAVRRNVVTPRPKNLAY